MSCRWRDLHAKEAQLKTYMEKSGKILKVHLPLISSADISLSHTTTSSPPLGRQSWATMSVQASLEPGGVKRPGRAFYLRCGKPWSGFGRRELVLNQRDLLGAPNIPQEGPQPVPIVDTHVSSRDRYQQV